MLYRDKTTGQEKEVTTEHRTGKERKGRDRKHNRYEDMRGKGKGIVVVMVLVQ